MSRNSLKNRVDAILVVYDCKGNVFLSDMQMFDCKNEHNYWNP